MNSEWSADNSLSHACPIAAQMLLNRNRVCMVKGEHITIGSKTAETNDRTILLANFGGIFCSVTPHTMRLPLIILQFRQKIKDDCRSSSKVFAFFLHFSVSRNSNLSSSSLVILLSLAALSFATWSKA